MDLVDVLEGYCNELDWVFSYGNSANNNLLMDVKENKVYLILDPVRTTEGISANGGDGVVNFSGSFMLIIKSNLDNVYHNQLDVPRTEGKYVKNIQPLKEHLNALKGLIDCSNLERANWSVIDAIDIFDENMDGIIITYSLNYL